MMPPAVFKALDHWLREFHENESGIKKITPVSGGSINKAFAIDTTSGKYFVKFNDAELYPGMFAAEARGLQLIGATSCIEVPRVLHSGNAGFHTYLLMEYARGNESKPCFWEEFGRQLASLHRVNEGYFGLNHDNYIGSLRQNNQTYPSWTGFLIQRRLNPMIIMARDSGILNSNDCASFERMFAKLDDLIPAEPPSLLHGDLWNGNFITGKNGAVCLIDPAVYYGHRETDLAMTRLFGGFHQTFYDAYNESWPLETGWNERIELNQLYPLLVHVNLFGGSYVSAVKQVLLKYL